MAASERHQGDGDSPAQYDLHRPPTRYPRRQLLCNSIKSLVVHDYSPLLSE
jgi:hypothetical protein